MEHCWHGCDGTVLDVSPPVYPVRCCNCGERGGMTKTLDTFPVEGHGPFFRVRKTVYTVGTECPGRGTGENP
jgi:hypothetical protein